MELNISNFVEKIRNMVSLNMGRGSESREVLVDNNMLLRASIHFMKRSQHLNSQIKIPRVCKNYVVVSNNNQVEVWIWCKHVNDFLTLLENYLYAGFMPTALGLLDGEYILIENLDFTPETLYRLISKSTTLKGTVFITYYGPPTWIKEFIKLDHVRNIKVFFQKKKAVLEIRKPINTTLFFDHLLRVVKPIKIPP